jgi:ADP-ribosylglycohydrolase
VALTRVEQETYRSRVRGCLLGGAIGDAMGGPVESWSRHDIVKRFGDTGVRRFVAGDVNGRPVYGRVTANTQLTLFTVEGIIRASVRTDRGLGFTVGVLAGSFDRWLDTQLLDGPTGLRDGWLIGEQWLYSRRAPAPTCLAALAWARDPNTEPRMGQLAANESKGSGGVTRSAPFGLVLGGLLRWQFDSAGEAAGYTHGHRTARLAAATFAAIVGGIVRGETLEKSVVEAMRLLAHYEGHEETMAAVRQARAVARDEPKPSIEALESLGSGWIAEEALAIGLYVALTHPRPDRMLDALALAVSHSGDSDATGSICGQLLGALHGETAIPPELAFAVEGRTTIVMLADDLALEFTGGDRLHSDGGPDTRWTQRYPGG